jgi:RNA polymerase sigma-70 factor, ECF subfamily
MSTNLTNETLVARACQGDKAAFGDLYVRLLDDIYRYVYYRVSNQQDAEDLTETVFLKAWQGLPNYKPEGAPFMAWLYRIAHNTVVDHYRTYKTAEPLADHPYLPDEREPVEAQVFSQTEIEQLKAKLQQMTPIHQEVLVLRFINELSPAETAAALDKSNGAVRVLQHRALKELQALMTVGDIIDE